MTEHLVEQIKYALRCALAVLPENKEQDYREWARKWASGEDRTIESAQKVEVSKELCWEAQQAANYANSAAISAKQGNEHAAYLEVRASLVRAGDYVALSKASDVDEMDGYWRAEAFYRTHESSVQ